MVGKEGLSMLKTSRKSNIGGKIATKIKVKMTAVEKK